MAQKAETYIDKSGNSWLVFYDKDGPIKIKMWWELVVLNPILEFGFSMVFF